MEGVRSTPDGGEEASQGVPCSREGEASRLSSRLRYGSTVRVVYTVDARTRNLYHSTCHVNAHAHSSSKRFLRSFIARLVPLFDSDDVRNKPSHRRRRKPTRGPASSWRTTPTPAAPIPADSSTILSRNRLGEKLGVKISRNRYTLQRKTGAESKLPPKSFFREHEGQWSLQHMGAFCPQESQPSPLSHAHLSSCHVTPPTNPQRACCPCKRRST